MSDQKSSARRLTINAAFLKDIKDDNRELHRLLDRVRALLEPQQVAVNHWSELGELVEQLRDQLALHFSLEEAYGYFDEAVGSAPQLSAAAELLRNQHASLFEQIRDLADAALDTPPQSSRRIEKLIKRLRQFIETLDQHEQAELGLILDSLHDDLGVGD